MKMVKTKLTAKPSVKKKKPATVSFEIRMVFREGNKIVGTNFVTPEDLVKHFIVPDMVAAISKQRCD